MHSKEPVRPDPSVRNDAAPWGVSTQFDLAGAGGAVPAAGPALPSAFDVCHVGVVLRVVLGVQLVTGLGGLFVSAGPAEALAQWAQASLVSLPASLAWLLVACAARPAVDRLPTWAQWLVATGLGAVCGALAQWQANWLFMALEAASWSLWSLLPTAAAGALLGGVGLYWLRQRARSELPAHVAARLDELQARIQPHFLFNTLNTAIALVQIDPARAEQVLEDLAELFRQALMSPSARTTLGQEIDLARRYLAIEQLRFGERLTVRWEVDPEVHDAQVPSLLLQPLVENAVRHGVEPDPRGGWLVVRARLSGDKVELGIRNSVADEASAQARPGHGMALRNVRQRLVLMHDVEATFEAGVQRHPHGPQPPVYTVNLSFPYQPASAPAGARA